MAQAPPPDTDTALRPSLPLELRAATREKHHTLNTLIASRLPLCLSPHVDSPVVYAKGMATFGQIYFAFEDFLAASRATGLDHQDSRLGEIYDTLHLPQLTRTNRLRQDIVAIRSRVAGPAAEEIVILEDESKVFYSRIYDLLSARPHVLLGYMWAMYLALFNGGRWIRGQLVSQGSDFWLGQLLPLSFWEFNDGGEDSHSKDEQLKGLFQERLLAAASLLRDDERDDVIEETGRVFELCSEIVQFLDDKLSTVTSTTAPASLPKAVESQAQGLPGPSSPVTTAWQYLTSSYESLRTVTARAGSTKQSSEPKS